MARRLSHPTRATTAGPNDAHIASAADFGGALRRRRKELGHTLTTAAALCRVGVRFLSELERGKPTAELGRALKVARRLGLDFRLEARATGHRSVDQQPSDLR
jgi:transcriptional regulator with XRE-family HTH domain